MGANQCPKCLALMILDEERKSNKVECLVCKKNGTPTIFCWICLNKWKDPMKKTCGNCDCSIENVNILLEEAPIKTINTTKDI